LEQVVTAVAVAVAVLQIVGLPAAVVALAYRAKVLTAWAAQEALEAAAGLVEQAGQTLLLVVRLAVAVRVQMQLPLVLEAQEP
jgi:hypothetical protein